MKKRAMGHQNWLLFIKFRVEIMIQMKDLLGSLATTAAGLGGNHLGGDVGGDVRTGGSIQNTKFDQKTLIQIKI